MTSKRLRVTVRRPDREDCGPFLAAMKASASLHRSWIKPPSTPSAFAAYIERLERDDHDARFVCLRDTDEIVGVVNFNSIIRNAFCNAYLGYYGVAAHAGHGLMTEGMRLALRYGFNTLRLHRVEANIQPDNVASIALVRRCGFTREGFSERYLKIAGRWRDHERWALRAEQFKLTCR